MQALHKACFRKRSNSVPTTEDERRPHEYGECVELVKDKVGRSHVSHQRLGPAQLFLRSIKYSPVTIATHAADWLRTVASYLKTRPETFAVNTSGDGCSDLACSRLPNMICYFDALVELQKTYPRLAYAQFGQYAPDDSPCNPIERMWATARGDRKQEAPRAVVLCLCGRGLGPSLADIRAVSGAEEGKGV